MGELICKCLRFRVKKKWKIKNEKNYLREILKLDDKKQKWFKKDDK